ncbi:MAG TPA: hypothetical protein VK448_07375 [Dissulfurispiraceae bacterium]|nr:hypothetical protein [Dissulfurispiraceae bacterium]
MKKALLIIGAVTVMLAGFASQSSAGVDVHVGVFAPLPGIIVPAPIPVYHERVVPAVVETETYYRPVPAGYHRVIYEEPYWRHHHRWDHDRYRDRHDDWRRHRADRHWDGYRDYR